MEKIMEPKNQENGTNSEEHSKVLLLRSLVQKKDPSIKAMDDLAVRRFLRARDLNVKEAAAMLLKYLKWRKTFAPNGYILPVEIQHDIAQKKQFAQGVDKQGRPITVLLAARHFANKKGGVDEFKRFVVFALDKLCARMAEGQEKFVVIGDLQGYGYANCDIQACIGSLSILQDYYPERLGKLFLVHVPSIFMMAWKLIHPFIDKKTKKKIIFVDNEKMKQILLEDIDEAQIPDIYGGKLPLVPIENA